jgi:CRP/FNR family transcriptional regulator
MRALLSRHPEIAVKLVISLGRRLRAANERLARQSFQTVQSRVAAVLAQLVEQARAEGAGERDILLTATQAELAQLAGSSRESASRFLAVLERAGVISQGRGRLTVHDPAALGGYVY